MIENIIVYGMCFFLSLLAFGASWYARNQHVKLKIIISIIVPISIVAVYFINPDWLKVFDVHSNMSWVYQDDSAHMAEYRFRFLLVILSKFLVIGYMVIIYHVLFAKKYI